MSFTLFWEAVDIDGANTLNDGTFDLGVWIDTPSNGSHHPTEWVIGTDIIGDRPTIQSANVKDPTEIEVGFEREITGLSFELYDVDQGKSWDDKVTILATNAAGDEVEVVFSDVEATHLVTGGTIEGEGNARASIDGPGAADSVTVTIAGPVSNIRILHDNGHDVARSGTVGMSDWTFDAVPPRDGIVSGTDDDDTIVVDEYVDRDGDEIDNEDALIPGDGPNDDRVEAGDGDDTVAARDGDDTVEGGEGNDTVDGGDGDDVLYGNDIGDLGDIIDDPAFDPPAPDPDPENDRDSLSGGDGDDQIFGQDDRDTLDGGDGNDTLDGGIDDDEITGGAGNDSVIGGQGDDVIDTGVFGAPDRGYPGLFPGDSDPRNDRDTVDGGLGDDVIRTGDDNDVIDAGEGDDTVNAGFDDDDVTAGEGDDSIIAGEGSDTVRGGDGDDTIFGGIGEPDDPINIIDDADAGFPAPDLVPDNGRDLLDGGDGDDEIFGEDDDDTLIGGDGNDTLDGGIDDDDLTGGTGRDSLVGGQGQDTLAGGAGADTLEGGDDEDLFRVSGPTDDGDDVIDGGAGGTDLDQIDISKLGQFNVDWRLENLVTDSNGNGFDGDLVFLDGAGGESGRLAFSEIEIICFTPGTQIATPKGPKLVEELCAGDRVLTRDNGVQEVAWYGQTGLNAADFQARPHLTPILIRRGALGNGLPERDMVVSPQHRVLVTSDRAALYFDDREVLVAAKHLVNGTSILRKPVPQTTYIHFMCAQHEVVLSDGAWTESFQPGDFSMNGIDTGQRREIEELFPELATSEGRDDYAAARRTLKRHEAMLLSRG